MPQRRTISSSSSEVAARVFDGAEEAEHGCAGRIVDGEQQGEARAASLDAKRGGCRRPASSIPS